MTTIFPNGTTELFLHQDKNGRLFISYSLDKNGVVAFVSNNSFINARTYDGFRKVVAEEFNEIWIIDLKGNAHTTDERRRKEAGNVFSDKIRVGIAVYFLIRNENLEDCKIFYNAIRDYAKADEKKAYLQEHKFRDLSFEHVVPDKYCNWINLTDNDFDNLLSLADKKTKLVKNEGDTRSVFKLFSLGVVTNRDDWVYDLSKQSLARKMRYFFDKYNLQRKKIQGKRISDDELSKDLKWTRDLKKYVRKGIELNYQNDKVVTCVYRPYVKKFLYYDQSVNEMRYQMPNIFPSDKKINIGIFFNDRGARSPFSVLAVDTVGELHFCASTDGFQCLPRYRYDEHGNRVENITDWGLQQFREHYGEDGRHPSTGSGQRLEGEAHLTKEDIFHYTYAVLHNPAYRKKYELNLKREFPRLPFYEDFWQWVEWGKQLMKLHLNYETVEPYPLERRDQHVVQQTMPGTPESAQPVTTPKSKLKADKLKHTTILDTETSLHGVPPIAWEYKLGNRSALEWVLDQYKEKKPKDPTIREKFNTYRFVDYKEHVIDLLKRVCTVSVKTMEIIQEMERSQEG